MQRLLISATVLVLAVACGGAKSTTAPSQPVPSAATTAAASPVPGTSVAVTLADFKINAAATTVPSNVTFNVHSDGPTPHNFTVRESDTVSARSSARFPATKAWACMER
jgi:hypothetical protein